MDDNEPDHTGNGRFYLQKFGLRDDGVSSLNLFLDGQQVGPEGVLEVAKGLAENWSLTSLELRRNEVGPAGAVPLAQALASNKFVRYLGVGRNKLTNTGAVHIAEALKVNQTLEAIDLEWNELRDESAQALAEVLVMNNSLLSLSLERNKIQKDGIAAIGSALAENSKLRNLNLGWNKARVVGAIAIADGLRENSSLVSLNLAMNQIPQEGAFAIANALRDNSALQSLNLQHNRIGDALVMFGDSLRVNGTLRELNCEGNYLSPDTASVFGRALRDNRSLMSLNLARNEIRDAGVAAIAGALRSSSALRYLDFSETGVREEGVAAVCELLDSCPNLQTVVLDDNPLGPSSAQCIAAKLRSRVPLTSLSLSRTRIEPAGVKALGEALRPPTRHYLRSLQLAGLGAGYEPTLALCSALSYCSSLLSLDLSGNDMGGTLMEPLCRVLVANKGLPYVYLKDNDLAAETANYALLRGAADEFLAKSSGVRWSPDADEPEDGAAAAPAKEAYVPSATFASRNVSTGNALVGPVDDIFRPSELSALQPLRGTQVFQPGDGEQPAAAIADAPPGASSSPMLKHGASAAANPLVGPPRRSPVCGSGRSAALGKSLYSQKPTAHMTTKMEKNISGLLLSDDQLRKEFNRLDRNGNGYLEEEEFKAVYRHFENFGVESSERQIDDIVRRHNMRGDKRITFDEYCIIMLGLASR